MDALSPEVALSLPAQSRGGAPPTHDAQSLVARAQRGSAAAAEALVRDHWARAHRTAYLIVGDAGDAEDVAQEALLAALRSLKRFDRRRPFEPWLHRIVVNRSLDALRARGRRAEPSSPRLSDAGSPEPPGAGSMIADDDLVAAVRGLPIEQRVVVVLRYALGYPTGEIATLLELSRGTVGSRLRRGLDQLRASLGEDEE